MEAIVAATRRPAERLGKQDVFGPSRLAAPPIFMVLTADLARGTSEHQADRAGDGARVVLDPGTLLADARAKEDAAARYPVAAWADGSSTLTGSAVSRDRDKTRPVDRRSARGRRRPRSDRCRTAARKIAPGSEREIQPSDRCPGIAARHGHAGYSREQDRLRVRIPKIDLARARESRSIGRRGALSLRRVDGALAVLRSVEMRPIAPPS